jgi:hypothetical protein
MECIVGNVHQFNFRVLFSPGKEQNTCAEEYQYGEGGFHAGAPVWKDTKNPDLQAKSLANDNDKEAVTFVYMRRPPGTPVFRNLSPGLLNHVTDY